MNETTNKIRGKERENEKLEIKLEKGCLSTRGSYEGEGSKMMNSF